MTRPCIWLLLAVFLIPIVAAACGPSPKAKASDVAKRFPDTIGEFELEEDDRIELTAESIGSTGHVTLAYTRRNVGEVFIVIDVYGTEAAADVAEARRDREWLLSGYSIEADRQPGQLTAQVAEFPQGRVAVFQEDELVITVQYIRDEAADSVDDESWERFLLAVRCTQDLTDDCSTISGGVERDS